MQGLFHQLGPWEVVIILAVILLLFGGRKLPELARGLAKGLREFRDEMKGISKDVEESADISEKDHPDEDNGQPPS